MQIFIKVFLHSLEITLLVMVMMIAVDLLNVWTHGKLAILLRTGKKWKQYIVTSFLGAIPGCSGSFAGVSLYVHGMIGMGALAGTMIATSGDEAFVMLAVIPETALLIFAILFILGIFSGKIIDLLIRKFKIPTCTDCEIQQFHKNEKGFKHYLVDHIWKHIIKHHLWKIFLWTFTALLLIELGTTYWKVDHIVTDYAYLLLIISALIGIIPESGPHIFFITLFSQGLIPFSILLTSSIVQDGHGMLPMLSYSVKDSITIKAFNVIFGLVIGSILFFIGI